MLAAAAILLQLGACEIQACTAHDLDERAHALIQACGDGPTEKPAGVRCIVEAAILWRLESRFSWYPPARGTGLGPLQVLATRLHNARIGYVSTPPAAALREPLKGLRWGVYLLRLKARYGSWRSRARAYNGSHLRDRYAARAVRLDRRLSR